MGFYIDLPSDGTVTLGLLALAALITVYFLLASLCIRAHRRSTVKAIRGEREAMRQEFATLKLATDDRWCPCKVIPDHRVSEHKLAIPLWCDNPLCSGAGYSHVRGHRGPNWTCIASTSATSPSPATTHTTPRSRCTCGRCSPNSKTPCPRLPKETQ